MLHEHSTDGPVHISAGENIRGGHQLSAVDFDPADIIRRAGHSTDWHIKDRGRRHARNLVLR